jgi:hypothetical protein
MTITIMRGVSDPIMDSIQTALKAYEEDHPEAEIAIYRHNSASVRLRIIDPGFANLSRARRSERAWEYLRRIPEYDQGELSVVLLLAPDEVAESFGNLDFEHPIPSGL